MNRIFYIMGKSSSGKDSIYKMLLNELNLTPIILHTTRPMRENEQQDREYHFVDRQCYEEMKSTGKVLESRIYNTIHGEWIYFTSDDSINLKKGHCLGIGTLESYVKIKEKLGDLLIPIYIEVDDGIRLIRAIQREQLESQPRYAELCRRFLADAEDFSEDKLKSAGITKRFYNNDSLEKCFKEIKLEMKSWEK